MHGNAGTLIPAAYRTASGAAKRQAADTETYCGHVLVPPHPEEALMWSDSAQLQELLERARQGDVGAQEQLLGQHREALRRMIALRLDPAIAARVDASDVVQDVLFEASRRLEEYLKQPPLPFPIWLRHLARDHIIDAYRRHRLAQRRGVDREQPLVPAALVGHSSAELLGQLHDPERTPASAVVQQEQEHQLHQAITRLDENDREIILMRHFEQMSNLEVATALNLTQPAASMRYLRALRHLRELLEEVD
jgi:RNA polymerase sigma-70 factor (ECF subfamily)